MPGKLAAGVFFALLLALVSTGNLVWFCLFVVTFFLKINLADTAVYEAVLAEKRAEVEERVHDIRQEATGAVKSQLESQLEKLPLPKMKF